MPNFQVVSDYTPSGDQPEAIEALAQGVELGLDEQTLLGVTGSGKTFTMAKVIEKVQRPTLVLAHNKTLAAQLCAEFREFFPNNAVEYFVSYYDYYQPEAYIPHTDTFIEKDSAINDEIERLRHSATSALLRAAGRHRRGLRLLHLRPGRPRLTYAQHGHLSAHRAGADHGRACSVSSWRSAMSATTWPLTATASGSGGTRWRFSPPTAKDHAIRVEFFGDEIDRISEINAVTGDAEPACWTMWPSIPPPTTSRPRRRWQRRFVEI